MKNIFKYKINVLGLLLVLAGLVFLSSCDDEESASKEIVLLSFGPSGVHHGDEIVFIGQNLDKVTSIVLKPAVEISKDAFTSVSSDRITLIVPDAAEAGQVILKTPSGEIASKTILNFEVPVVVSSITAEAKPGTNITITGDKINWIETVTFSSDVVVEKANFVSQSLTELVVQVPMEAQSGFIIFSTGGTEPLTFGSQEQLIVTLPTVTSLAPASIRHTGVVTLTGTDLDLIESVIFSDNVEVAAANFESKSATEIKVAVPATAVKGKLTLTQASPVTIETASELTIILPVGTSVTPTPAVPGQDEITIAGTDLDLVDKLLLPGAGEILKASFVSQSATEIKLAVPATATQGAIEYVTIHGFNGPLGVILKLPSTGGIPTLDYYIYKDGLQNGWEAYNGWGHVSQSYDNTENPLSGTMAIKSVFNDQWGAIQIKNNSGASVFNGYNYLVFYVHVVGEDSDIIAQIGDNADFDVPQFTKDKYHQIVVPLADLAGSDNVNELRIKNNNPVDDQNTVVFIDEIGLTIDPPLGLLPDLITVLYDDEIKNGFQQWGGSTDWSNTEQARSGSNSIKMTFGGSNWGVAGQFGGASVSTAGTTHFVFSVYGGAGTDGKNLQVLVKRTGGESTRQVAIVEGEWTDFEIPLSDLGSPADITEFFFQNADFTDASVFVDHVGLK